MSKIPDDPCLRDLDLGREQAVVAGTDYKLPTILYVQMSLAAGMKACERGWRMGMAPGYEQFACEACGRTYRFKPELAGQKVKCACGQVMTAPTAPPQVDALYDLVEDSPVSKSSTVMPRLSPGTILPSGQTSQAPVFSQTAPVQPLAYRSPGTPGDGDKYSDAYADQVKNFYIPLAMIVFGLIVEMGQVYFIRGPKVRGVAFMMGMRGIGLILDTGLMLLAIFIATKFREIKLGPLAVAALKLCAISLGPGAAQTLATVCFWWIPIFGCIGPWVLGFMLYFALIGALFDLDQSDTWYCVCIIFVVKVAFVVAAITGSLRWLL